MQFINKICAVVFTAYELISNKCQVFKYFNQTTNTFTEANFESFINALG